jgi:hypothetical protein
MFVDDEHWYKQSYDKDWDVIMPALQSYNGLHQKLFIIVLLILDESMFGWRLHNKLFITVLLILDESMSGWRPKTTAYGELPSITFGP